MNCKLKKKRTAKGLSGFPRRKHKSGAMLSNYLTPTSLYPDILLHWVLPVKVYLSPCPVQSCASQLNILTPSLISLVDRSLPLVQLPSVPWQPQVFLLLTKNTSAKMSWSESWHLKICWCPCGKTVSLSLQPILLTGPLLFVLPCCLLLETI